MVKAYVSEPGSTPVRKILKGVRAETPSTRIYLSRLAYPETLSAVARKSEELRIGPSESSRLISEIQRDFTGPVVPYGIVDPAPEIVNLAARLVVQYRIRGFDAVHLGTALELFRDLGPNETLRFTAADARLLAAAKAAGLDVLDVGT